MSILEKLQTRLNDKFKNLNESQSGTDEYNRDYSDLFEMIDEEIEKLGKLESGRFYTTDNDDYLVYDDKENQMLVVSEPENADYITVYDGVELEKTWTAI